MSIEIPKSIIDSIAVLLAGLSLLITVMNNRKIIHLTRSAQQYDLRAQLTHLFVNLVKLTSEIYLMEYRFYDSNHKEDKIKLNNLRNERGVIVEQISAIILKHPNLISYAEYSELAKSKFAMFDFELARKYHLLAIELSSEVAQINCKRYYADFLYRIKQVVEGRKLYSECEVKGNSDTDKLVNGITFRMWMNSEIFNGNPVEAKRLYSRSKLSFDLVSEETTKRHYISQLNIDASSLFTGDL